MSHRKVHINGAVWTYSIGKSNIQIRQPDGHRVENIPTHEFVGMTIGDYEHDCWKGNCPQIGPQEIKKHILARLKEN